MRLYPLFRPLIFALEAERAHRATIAALKAIPARAPPPFAPSLQVRVAGLDFPTPVGLAAGFDKDAEVAEAMLGLGFGFVEVGTLTPLPQGGNPKPRLFRLPEDRGVINRLGFNNAGQRVASQRLNWLAHTNGIVGVNIGANKDSADRIADYIEGVRAMAPFARYLTINISSPNTPGLRGLQGQGELDELLAAVSGEKVGKPIFLKVAPDLADGDHGRIVRSALDHGIDALIVGNTTVTRPSLRSPFAGESGGLSGAPLKVLALDALRRFRSESGGELPLVGVGGIESAPDAWERICAGASLVQLYTGMIYEGPGIARRIADGLAARLEREGLASIGQAVGRDAN